MELKQLFADEDAVSPVIGVILMVAITVILAAVIGTFVLGLGDQVGNNAPQASFSFDYTQGPPDELEVVHNGGGKIEAAQLSVKISGANENDGSYTWNGADLGGSTEVTAGDSVTLQESTTGDNGGSDYDLSSATVRVIWTSEGGDSSAELATWTGPDA